LFLLFLEKDVSSETAPGQENVPPIFNDPTSSRNQDILAVLEDGVGILKPQK